eukprot:s1_g771.t1
MLLRWLAVAGQLAAVLFVYFVLQFPLPLGFCLAAIAASAWLNVFLSLRYRTPVRLPDNQAAAYLAYDLLQLAALLYLTGGLGNPFTLLFMVPVTISATTLSPKSTGLLLSLAFVCVTVLSVYHLPLPWTPDAPLVLPGMYQAGIWAGLLLGLGFVAVYAYRIADEARRMSNALEATELVLAREQRLSALDGLAAAAAHELGTPLGTIALVARELQRDKPTGDQLDEDLNLLRSQAERCKEILSRLTHQPDARDALYARIEIDALLSEIVAPHRDMDVSFDLATQGEGATAPSLVRRPEILYGLGNFVENASDFARRTVTITGDYDEEMVCITIIDDGPGFPVDMVDRLGEPYGEPLVLVVGRSNMTDEANDANEATQEERSLLLVDDDAPFLGRLARAMESRGFAVSQAGTVKEGVRLAQEVKPDYAVVDLRLDDGSGLEVVSALHTVKEDARVIVLTGYGNIATAVEAVKLGAVDYLSKPADADDVEAALLAQPGEKAPPPENPMSADRVRWEHIQRVYELCNRNVSETARRLNMHRRTLQRILAKRAPR